MQVYESGGWHSGQCSRRGIIKFEGELYCKQHSEVKKRRAQQEKDFDKKQELRDVPYKEIESLRQQVTAITQERNEYKTVAQMNTVLKDIRLNTREIKLEAQAQRYKKALEKILNKVIYLNATPEYIAQQIEYLQEIAQEALDHGCG